ncbi:MAG: hypothetical protein QXN71_04060 [Candidatus Aenigmatarchaeota archaeon]
MKEYYSIEPVEDFVFLRNGRVCLKKGNVLTPLVKSRKLFRITNPNYPGESTYYQALCPLGRNSEYFVDLEQNGKHRIFKLKFVKYS